MPVNALSHRIKTGQFDNKMDQHFYKPLPAIKTKKNSSDTGIRKDVCENLIAICNTVHNLEPDNRRPAMKKPGAYHTALLVLSTLSQIQLANKKPGSISLFSSGSAHNNDTAASPKNMQQYAAPVKQTTLIQDVFNHVNEFLLKYDPLTFPVAAAAVPSERKRDNKFRDVKANKNRSPGKDPVKTRAKDYVSLKRFYDLLDAQYPDITQSAAACIKNIIYTRHGLKIDPDKVYLNTYKFAQSNSASFTGWIHTEKPLRSIRLTHCLMENFRSSHWSNPDEINVLSAIYDEKGKMIPLLPSDLARDIWEADFYTKYADQLVDYWNKYEDAHKISNLAVVIAGLETGRVNRDIKQRDRNLLLTAFNLPGATEKRESTSYIFDIDGYFSTDVIVFKSEQDNSLVVFTPRADSVFYSFDDMEGLQSWLARLCQNKQHRNSFLQNFAIKEQIDGEFYYGVERWLEDIGKNDLYKHKIMYSMHKTEGDIIDFITQRQKARSFSDCDNLIKSNSEVIRDMWIEGLEVAGFMIPHPFVFFAKVALDIEKGFDADNDNERSEASQALFFDGVNILLLTLSSALDASITMLPDGEVYLDAENIEAVNNYPEVITAQQKMLSGLSFATFKDYIFDDYADLHRFKSTEKKIINELSVKEFDDITLSVENSARLYGTKIYQISYKSSPSAQYRHIRMNGKYLAFRITADTDVWEIYSRNAPEKAGYPVMLDEDNRWIFKDSRYAANKFSQNINFSPVSASIMKKIDAGMFEETIDTSLLGPRDTKGIIRGAKGKKYLQIGEEYILIRKLSNNIYAIGSEERPALACIYNKKTGKFVDYVSKGKNEKGVMKKFAGCSRIAKRDLTGGCTLEPIRKVTSESVNVNIAEDPIINDYYTQLKKSDALEKIMQSPAAKCADAAKIVADFLNKKSIKDLRCRIIYMWSNGNKKIRSKVTGHIVVIAPIEEKNYVFDLTAHQFSQSGLSSLDSPLILEESQWINKYASATTRRLIKYRDFHDRIIAENFLENNIPESWSDPLTDGTILTAPDWYYKATGRANPMQRVIAPRNLDFLSSDNVFAKGSRGTVYESPEGELIKVYKNYLSQKQKSSLLMAAKNAEAFRRIYGEDSAVLFLKPIEDETVSGKALVLVAMKKIPGETLSSIFQSEAEDLTHYRRSLSFIKPEIEAKKIANKFRGKGVMHHDINNANILYDDANGFNLIDFDDATILPKGKKLDALQTEEIRKKVNSAIEKFIKYINRELTLRDVL